MRLVVISDTHANRLRKWKIPDADVLLHCGDFSTGVLSDVRRFADDLRELPHRHKLVIAGNHDFANQTYELDCRRILDPVCCYLQDEAVEIDGIKFYGTPWQPWFLAMAFNLERGSKELSAKWDAIPADTDVLLTHCPPEGILDWVGMAMKPVGCAMLRYRYDAGLIRPLVHCFGHVHEARGRCNEHDTLFVNASCVRGENQPVETGPVVIELDITQRRVVKDYLAVDVE
jgi:Icc-related predicted phosphoesterase